MIKLIKILFIIWLIFETFHVALNESNIRIDIFLLYDYPGSGRYLTNILYDLSVHFYWLASTFIFWRVFRYFKIADQKDVILNKLSNMSGYVKVIFFWRVLEFIFYLLICNQSTNLVTLPILFIMIIYENRKTD